MRQGKFPIIGVSAVYSEDEYYEAVVIAINEQSEIESFSVESFEVEEGVNNLIGAYLEYKEDEDEYIGKIVKS